MEAVAGVNVVSLNDLDSIDASDLIQFDYNNLYGCYCAQNHSNASPCSTDFFSWLSNG